MAQSGGKAILDGYKRREILAILAAGGTRPMAAKYVGCTSKTIQNTAQRDPKFAEELRRRTHESEIGYLQNIRNAARDERHWRAAAWALERICPERYGPRRPHTVTVEQVKELLAQFAEIIVEEVPVAEFRKRILKRLDGLSSDLKGAPKKGTKTEQRP